ncbi:MAG: hypothetical protein WDM79_13805 [Terricaulis sp.]
MSVPTDAQLQASAERMERERRRAANMQARPQSDMVRGVQEAAGDQAAREFPGQSLTSVLTVATMTP